MKLPILHRRQSPAPSAVLRLGNAWKLGFVLVAAALLMARGTAQPAVHLQQHILPSTVSSDPSACAPFPAAAESEPLSPPGVVVGHNSTLVIDGSQGPVQIFSHGAGIYVAGGELHTIGTGADNSVTFDAEPDVASWDGIRIAADTNRQGDASLSYVSIQHALTGINITSGATSSPDDNHYGLTVHNSGI
ncbi:MAG: hypothetical protein E6I68_11410, partial [Chloroflexi bacterium]